MRKEDATVILGTAHLGTTPGKRSPDGQFREAVYSREIVERVEAELKARGFKVVVDYRPLEPNGEMAATSASAQNSRELIWRANYVNRICKEAGSARRCLYVSVHVNAAGNGGKWMSAGGWCAYTSVGQTRADKLADCLYEAAHRHLGGYEKQLLAGKQTGAYDRFQKAFRTDTSDGDVDMEANFYVLLHTSCASCLTENLFQDNRSDIAFLTSEEGRASIVALHVDGIAKYVEEVM